VRCRDEGAALLCGAAARSALQVLDLGECELGAGACGAVRDLLAAAPPLVSLLLADNPLGADGVCAGAVVCTEGVCISAVASDAAAFAAPLVSLLPSGSSPQALLRLRAACARRSCCRSWT
jgi:hypothetical protein